MQNQQPEKKQTLEKMSDFFNARLDMYEEHMLTESGIAAYKKVAELVPADTKKLLDLGCGTGLELEYIFERLPDISVVGIDLTQSMLDRINPKLPGKSIDLICGDYFKIDFGENIFDTAISCATLHHFSREDKIELYKRIRQALKPNGLYIEDDYMVTEQAIEDELRAENIRLRREMNISPGEFYHFDIPFTVENQIEMLLQAGFSTSENIFRQENTTIIVAKK